MKTLSLLLPLLLLYSCHKASHNKHILYAKESGTTVFSVKDSLIKYSDAKDLLLIGNDTIGTTLYIGKAGRHSFAIHVLSEHYMVFYQKPDNKKWVATDSLNYKMPFSFATATDLNGDCNKDVKVSSLSGMAGNTENIVFLFDRKSRLFKHNEYYDLPNVTYYKKHNFVGSSWYAGAVHCQDKQHYTITGDSLIFYEGVTFCPDTINGETGTVDFYKMQNTVRTILRSQSGTSGRMWTIFENTYWNSEHDMGD